MKFYDSDSITCIKNSCTAVFKIYFTGAFDPFQVNRNFVLRKIGQINVYVFPFIISA